MAGNPQMNVMAVNQQQRQMILQNGIEYKHIIYDRSFTDSPGATISIPVRNTGLLKRFIVQVSAIISGGASDVQTLQELGASNFFSNVRFYDFSNKERINTSGWHLSAVASAKRGRPYGAAFTSDTPLGYGNNVTNVQKAPTSINASASGTANFFSMFEVPIIRDELDWRGIIDANVVNATARLELTVNANMFAATSATDAVLSLYKSGSATKGTLDGYTITVYQIGFDQLPVDPQTGRTIIPIMDSSVAYMLNNTTETGFTANAEKEISFANNRTFYSLCAIYNNAGVLAAGTDITRFALQSANWTRWQEFTPKMAALGNRELLGEDFAKGQYFFNFANKPINTLQVGNVTLNITPSSAGATSTVLLGWESFAALALAGQGVTIGAAG